MLLRKIYLILYMYSRISLILQPLHFSVFHLLKCNLCILFYCVRCIVQQTATTNTMRKKTMNYKKKNIYDHIFSGIL